MLDNPLNYKVKFDKFNKSGIRTESIPITVVNERFVIIIEHYEGIQFIKFYPKKLKSTNHKYKKRVSFKKLPIKVYSTCIKIAKDRLKEDPTCIIGVYGEWDNIDVEKENKSSDRFKLWLDLSINTFSEKDYKTMKSASYNFFMIMNNNHYTDETLFKIGKTLQQNFNKSKSDFIVPTINLN